MFKKPSGIVLKFAMLFTVFAVIIIFAAGVNIFFIQQRILYAQMDESANNLVEQLADTIAIDYETVGETVFSSLDERFERVKKNFKLKDAFFSKEPPTGRDFYSGEIIADGNGIGYAVIVLDRANTDEQIERNSRRFTLGVGVATVVMMTVLSLYVYLFHIRRIKNLKETLERYTREKDPSIAEEIEKSVKDDDEIAALSMQASAMILELDNYMKRVIEIREELTDTKKEAELLSGLSKKDALTGVRNRDAYDNEIEVIDSGLNNPDTRFGIMIVDINNLRVINETEGHEKGNEAIISVCHIVCETYKHSPVFRIGANEFGVILKKDDYYDQADLAARLTDELEKAGISAAVGSALYSPAIDDSAKNVFMRAENEMLSRKKEMR